MILERDGVIVWASPNLYGMLGWDPTEWVGLRILDIVRPEIRPELERALEMNARMVNQTLRFDLPAADGEMHWLEFQTRPFVDADGVRDGTALLGAADRRRGRGRAGARATGPGTTSSPGC